jgi:alanyl-tRNA synthetase
MTVLSLTGNEIRQAFIDFFIEKGHTFVPSSSLVPGGDQTLLFTNAGMVQFKEVFLGTDKRPYVRATNSQKCMRVAGKHNDLEDVGRDNIHHTFFEMLGNWSFGDYYKKEAISWAWELLTEVWKLPKENLWATCFEDESDEIERDDEAANHWRQQPGFDPSHVLFFGRKENFWEMAETGPCGPNSEIHLDFGPEHCNKQDDPDHICGVNQNCSRYLELWNLVFIQYNRLDAHTLVPLPEKHVDTGMGLDRMVSVLQGVDSNYLTDLLKPLLVTVQELTGDTQEGVERNFTPYRVIADHARAITFLIADGVVPGNTGRNYVSRMIIRRAARFGTKIGLQEPFLAKVAETVIGIYGDFYPELKRNRNAILENITREEKRFQRTVERGVSELESQLTQLSDSSTKILSGEQAFDLYATYGLPLEITRDIAKENGLKVDEEGFHQALERHRIASGAGEVFGQMGDEEVDIYSHLRSELQAQGKLAQDGVIYDPYGDLQAVSPVLSLVKDERPIQEAYPGDRVEVLLSKTPFYVEAGGQVSDTGTIFAAPMNGEQGWEIRIEDMRKPAAGMIIHIGTVISGHPKVDDKAIASVDAKRRRDIMRNHTATHLLHHQLRQVLGDHALQAGSLVAPDRLRFDFTHSEAVTADQLTHIESGVNQKILDNYHLHIVHKPLQQAIEEGAMALFGEKYAETVRTITMGDPEPFSYELCGGTHVSETGDIGLFLIISESSVAAGIRRIEAVTGRGAYHLVQRRFEALNQTASVLDTSPEHVPDLVQDILAEIGDSRKQITALRHDLATLEFDRGLEGVKTIAGVKVLTSILPGADSETLRQMSDRFRQRYSSGVAVLASVLDGHPIVIAAVTEDLVERGIHAGELVKAVAKPLGGGGGGRPTLGQAGGKDAGKLDQALASVTNWIQNKLGA